MDNPFNKFFSMWEQNASELFENILRNPVLLQSMGKVMTGAMEMKAQRDKTMASFLKEMNLPTREEMDRALNKLNEMEPLLREVDRKVNKILGVLETLAAAKETGAKAPAKRGGAARTAGKASSRAASRSGSAARKRAKRD